MFEKIFNLLFEKKVIEKKQTQKNEFASIKKRGYFLQNSSTGTIKQKTCLSAYFVGLEGLKRVS